MYKFNRGVFLMAFSMMIILVSSCGNKKVSDGETSDSVPEIKGKEYTSAYVCPMHCEGSGSETEGKCPVCEMDYVKNNTHACPMHPDVKGIKGDKCGKCNMDLKAIEETDDHSGHDHG